METVKVLNAVATPVVATCNPDECGSSFTETLEETAKSMQSSLGGLCGEESKEKQAEGYLKRLMNYIKGNSFNADITATADKYKVPPQKLATNFFERALGTVGDILGIAINVVCNGLDFIVTTVSTVAHGIVSLIHKLASALGRIVTLNKTCVA